MPRERSTPPLSRASAETDDTPYLSSKARVSEITIPPKRPVNCTKRLIPAKERLVFHPAWKSGSVEPIYKL